MLFIRPCCDFKRSDTYVFGLVERESNGRDGSTVFGIFSNDFTAGSSSPFLFLGVLHVSDLSVPVLIVYFEQTECTLSPGRAGQSNT